MFRTTATSYASRAAVCTRGFHASAAAQKTVKEKVTEVADKVSKGVGKGLASALDKGEKATYAAKETLSSGSKEKAEEAEDVVKRGGKEAAAAGKKAKADVEKQL